MIRDLEEVLLQVPDAGSRDYMREAVLCYHSGAFRASVVIAVSAGMDDLRRKLESIASTGGAPTAAKAAHKNIDALFQKQDAFESSLLDSALKIDLLTPSEEKKLRTLLVTRHLCGHPSGHSGSAEEARGCITAIVDLILSRPAMLGMSAVESLATRVSGKAFFPSREVASDVCTKELAIVHRTHYPALVSKLVGSAMHLVQQSLATPPLKWMASDARHSLENITLFLSTLLGFAHTRDETWKRIGELIECKGADSHCLSIMAGSDGAGLQAAPALTRMRAVALVRRSLGEERARVAAKSWISDAALTSLETDDLKSACRDFAAAHPIDNDTAAIVFDLPYTEFVGVYLSRLVTDAASTSFDAANRAIRAMQSLGADQAASVSSDLRVTYLMNIASHHGRAYSANAADALLKDGLGARSDFCAAVREQLLADPQLLLDGSEAGLARLLKSSGNDTLSQEVLDAKKAPKAAEGEGDNDK